MKRIVLLLSSIFFVLQVSCHEGLADIVNFNIAGTYGTAPQGFTLFSEGDAFTIQGSFNTEIAPTMTLNNGSTINLQSWIMSGFYITYGAIVNLNSSVPLSQINSNYPSNGAARNDNDYRNGQYFVMSNYLTDNSAFYLAEDYTELSISKLIYNGTEYYSGLINYNYQQRSTPDGEFTIVDSVHNEIELQITEFTTHPVSNPVPVPPALYLLATGLIGLTGLRRKMK